MRFSLKSKTQTEASHERVNCEGRLQKKAACRRGVLSDLRDGRLRVRHIEEIDSRYEVPALIEDKFAGDTQVELVDAGQSLDSRGLQDDVLGNVDTLSVRNVEGFGRLDRETSVMLEVDAGAEFPRQLVGAIHFENVRGVEIQVVVCSVDAVVGVVEIVGGGFVREAAAVSALLALDGEAAEDLPLVGQAFDGSELDRVVRVSVELRNVGHVIVERSIFIRVR